MFHLLWHGDRLPAMIDWKDAVVKYARLIRRKASIPRAEGADSQGNRYYVQLVLEGVPYQKPQHTTGRDTIGLEAWKERLESPVL